MASINHITNIHKSTYNQAVPLAWPNWITYIVTNIETSFSGLLSIVTHKSSSTISKLKWSWPILLKYILRVWTTMFQNLWPDFNSTPFSMFSFSLNNSILCLSKYYIKLSNSTRSCDPHGLVNFSSQSLGKSDSAISIIFHILRITQPGISQKMSHATVLGIVLWNLAFRTTDVNL